MRVTHITIDENKIRDFYHRRDVLISLLGGVSSYACVNATLKRLASAANCVPGHHRFNHLQPIWSLQASASRLEIGPCLLMVTSITKVPAEIWLMSGIFQCTCIPWNPRLLNGKEGVSRPRPDPRSLASLAEHSATVTSDLEFFRCGDNLDLVCGKAKELETVGG